MLLLLSAVFMLQIYELRHEMMTHVLRCSDLFNTHSAGWALFMVQHLRSAEKG